MKLKWDQISERQYETGTDHGVLYTSRDGMYNVATPWSGLTTVTESPSGAEPTDQWADNIKYLTIRSAETFGMTIECYFYPREFNACNGEADIYEGVTVGQQSRESFGFSYRTIKGNDTLLNDYGYKLHLVYGCTSSPSEKGYNSVNDSPEAITFSFEITTTPIQVEGLLSTDGKPIKAISSLTLDSTVLSAAKMKAIEDILYGTETTEGRLPLPEEVFEILNDLVEPVAETLSGSESTGLGNVTAADLQSDVKFKSNLSVTGTLNYVTKFTGYSNNTAEQSGNFLAFKAEKPDIEGEPEMYMKYDGNPSRGEVKFDTDMIGVVRVKDKTKKLHIIAKVGEKVYDSAYDLRNLVLKTDRDAVDLSSKTIRYSGTASAPTTSVPKQK